MIFFSHHVILKEANSNAKSILECLVLIGSMGLQRAFMSWSIHERRMFPNKITKLDKRKTYKSLQTFSSQKMRSLRERQLAYEIEVILYCLSMPLQDVLRGFYRDIRVLRGFWRMLKFLSSFIFFSNKANILLSKWLAIFAPVVMLFCYFSSVGCYPVSIEVTSYHLVSVGSPLEDSLLIPHFHPWFLLHLHCFILLCIILHLQVHQFHYLPMV